MKNLTDQYKTWIILGIAVAVIIVLALNRTVKEDYLEEGEAIKVVKEYLIRKQEEIPSMEKRKCELTGITQLQQWDLGGGLKPWRWAIAYEIKDDVNVEKHLCYVNPWDGKIVGTQLLSTQFVGKENPNIKMHYPLQNRADAVFKKDVSQGRTKWN